MLLNLSMINRVFHHLFSVLMIGFSVFIFYGLLMNANLSESISLMGFGLILFIGGLLSLNRDINKLQFRSIELNGFDKEQALQIVTKILNDNKWNIRTLSEDKIVASGSRFDNNKHSFLQQEKMLTVLFSNDSVWINCIIEPPVSFRWSYGLNERIVNNIIDEFLRQYETDRKPEIA